MKTLFSEQEARENLEKGYDEARELLKDPEKTGVFLVDLEEKLHDMEIGDEHKKVIRTFISALRSRMSGEGREISEKTAVYMMSALMYIVSPVDAIPDCIPVIGQLDDIGVLIVCCNLVHDELAEYRKQEKKYLD